MREYQLPDKTYNQNRLHQDILLELTAAKFQGTSGRKGKMYALLADTATAADEAACTRIALAHDSQQPSAAEEIQKTVDTSRQLLIYCREQLSAAAPDVAAVKAQVKAWADGDARLANAITNAGALCGYNLATNTGYLQAALQAAQILVALVT